MRKNDVSERGRWAEELAARQLTSAGLELASRNYRCRWGEIDLIMRDGDILVFVEVRFRGHSNFTSGAESVDEHKQRKLIAAAEHYLQKHPAVSNSVCRFDVVSVSRGEGSEQPELQWIRQAFEA